MLGVNIKIHAKNQDVNPVQGENPVRRVKFVIGPQNVLESLVENHEDVGHADK